MLSSCLSHGLLALVDLASAARRRALVGTLALALPGVAAAVSLGSAQLDSGLGQPLDLTIPVRTEAGEDVDPKCIRLVNPVDDQLPALTIARISLERDGVLLMARIQSLMPINEPALRVVVEVGCARRMQREYVLLIDPPAIGRGAAVAERAPKPVPAVSETTTSALVFGEPRIQAVQGRRLQMTAPLLGPDAVRLSSACVRLVDDGGSPPVFEDARVRLAGASSARPTIEISSAAPLSERMLRIVVEAGCESAVRREFNVLVESAPVPTVNPTEATQAAARPAPRAVATGPQTAAPAADLARKPKPPAAIAPEASSERPAAPRSPATASVSDRLVLAVPEEPVLASAARPAVVPDASDELVKRLDQLSSEVKRLRGELDDANKRNSAMAHQLSQDRGWPLAGWIGGVMALAVAAWLAIIWRRRGGEPDTPARTEGPLTRIIGKPTVEAPAASPAPAGTALGSVLVGSHLSEMRPDLHVTEMADEEAIRELYADVIRGNTVPGLRRTSVDIPLDVLADDTGISGSVAHDGRLDAAPYLAPGDADELIKLSAVDRDADGLQQDETLLEPSDDRELPRSQMPTTALKPLDLDLDLSDFAQGNGKRPRG